MGFVRVVVVHAAGADNLSAECAVQGKRNTVTHTPLLLPFL